MSWLVDHPNYEFDAHLRRQDSAWSGHLNFAYDLVANLKPRTIVELGTHRGHSMFAFAQAVKDKGLRTTIYAIDSWEGDKQAGFYGDEIFSNVKEIIKDCYNKQKIILLRGYFNTFLDKFENQSVDILHIDGLHTYAAVKNDFEEWLPKVKSDGVILLHDITEKSSGFGVYKFWGELKAQYKTFEFDHSHGLGVIFLSTEKFIKLEPEIKRAKLYYEKSFEASILTEQLAESSAIIKNLDKASDEKDIHIRSLENELKTMRSSKIWRLRESVASLKRKDRRR